MKQVIKVNIVAAALAGWLMLGASSTEAQYLQMNLVGYQEGMGRYLDPNLNGWGLAFGPNGPFCVADTNTGVATFYGRTGKPVPVLVNIPAAPSQSGVTGLPAGVVYNPTSEFVISKNGKSAPAKFIFATLDGTISGWNPEVDPNNAVIMVDNSTELPFPASYSGLALGKNSHGQNVLYAADGGNSLKATNNRFDMFDGTFNSIGSFTDPNVAVEYPGNTAFQVEYEDGKLYVTFGGFAPPFGGVVDVFDIDGNLLKRFAANAPGEGPLVNPWGIAMAPPNFGKFSNALLIGNVEDGRINAFDPSTGAFLGPLTHLNGKSIVIPGLWDLSFGGDTRGTGKSNQLFFTAGPNFVKFGGNGLFGVIFHAGPQEPSAVGNK